MDGDLHPPLYTMKIPLGIQACKIKAIKEKSEHAQMATSGGQEQKATRYSRTNILLRDILGEDPLSRKNTQE